MEKNLKQFVKDKRLVTNKVNLHIGLCSKGEVSSMIGISRPTLNRRLKDNRWKLSEIRTILTKLTY